MIYVIKGGDFTKIGLTYELESQGDEVIAKSIQEGNPFELKGIGYYYCSLNFYNVLLYVIKKYKVRKSWYKFDFEFTYENILKLIGKHKKLFDFDTELLPYHVYVSNILNSIKEVSEKGFFITTYTATVEVGITKEEYNHIYQKYSDKIRDWNFKNTGHKSWYEYKEQVLDN